MNEIITESPSLSNNNNISNSISNMISKKSFNMDNSNFDSFNWQQII